MRVATYNVRNARALDRASWWWRRRDRVRDVIAGLEADVIGLQEAYPSQVRWVRESPCSAPDWEVVGRGRNADGGGEALPVFTRTQRLVRRTEVTRWFGPEPDRPGSRAPGASHPRIVTVADYDIVADQRVLTVANLHLDPASASRRVESVEQLVGWLEPGLGGPTVVLGDFNGPLGEPWHDALSEAGLRSALRDGAGPTANGFGDPAGCQQIDHVFVSADLDVRSARIVVDAGFASDHYPVVIDVDLRRDRSASSPIASG